MKIKENENISKYNEIIKESVSAIKSIGGKIDDVRVISKVLRTLLPIYAIKV